MYVYRQTEKACADNEWHDLWTVGYYDPQGNWQSDSDHSTIEQARRCVALLNGCERTLAQPDHTAELVEALTRLADDYEDLLKVHGQAHRWGMITVQNARAALAKVGD